MRRLVVELLDGHSYSLVVDNEFTVWELLRENVDATWLSIEGMYGRQLIVRISELKLVEIRPLIEANIPLPE